MHLGNDRIPADVYYHLLFLCVALVSLLFPHHCSKSQCDSGTTKPNVRHFKARIGLSAIVEILTFHSLGVKAFFWTGFYCIFVPRSNVYDTYNSNVVPLVRTVQFSFSTDITVQCALCATTEKPISLNIMQTKVNESRKYKWYCYMISRGKKIRNIKGNTQKHGNTRTRSMRHSLMLSDWNKKDLTNSENAQIFSIVFK